MNIQFKKGDKVFSDIKGKNGIVSIVDHTMTMRYPIKVIFEDNDHEYYTCDGRLYYDSIYSDLILKN